MCLAAQALERLAGIMESESSSIALLERGDLKPIARHPGFRIFAAMNPATDAGTLAGHLILALSARICD